MKPEIKYDPKSNILSIRLSQKKNVDSETKGNIVIDYDEKGEIVNGHMTNESTPPLISFSFVFG